jgi:hypothetical protein
MKLNRLPKYLKTLTSQPQVFFGNKQYLFLVSHMRSYTTLLSHILGSSDDINGYRENHIAYNSNSDLIKLRYRTQMAIEGKLGGTYILDKILHNHWVIKDEILSKDNLKVLFTIRQPEATVKSIINMGQKMVNEEWYLDQHKVAEYYEGRLLAIAEYARKTGKRGAYADAEILIEDPEKLTKNLSEWLGLTDPLKTEYKQFRDTGKPIHGDPSSNILEGKILKNKKRYDIDLDPDIIPRLNKVYESTKNLLKTECMNLGS